MPDEIVIETQQSRTVAADVLVRLIAGTQRVALLLGAAQDERPVDQRFRPSAELRARYVLRVGFTHSSSYAVPIEIVNSDPQIDMTWEDPTPKIKELIIAAHQGHWSRVDEIIPDATYRRRVMYYLRGMAPRSGEKWTAHWKSNGDAVPINRQLSRRIKTYLDRRPYTSQTTTVTGQLITAKFFEREAEIRLSKYNRILSFQYPDEGEDDLVRRRRDWVQLTGSFNIDEDGIPVSAIKITSVDALDLSPMRWDRIESFGMKLVPKEPLVLTPQLDDELNQYLEVAEPTLDLIAFGRNRDELGNAVVREIATAWMLYVHEDPNVLTQSAFDLAERLRSRFSEET